MNKHQSKKIKS